MENLAEALKNSSVDTKAFRNSHQLPFPEIEATSPGEKPFLACRYNRVGDKHRSPWSNKLHPSENASEADMDAELRKVEINMNAVWDAYKSLYYGGEAVGSVYLSASEKGPFRGAFCLQKKCLAGCWSSFHLVTLEDPVKDSCDYKVESTVLVSLSPSVSSSDTTHSTNIGARRSKETTETCKIRPNQAAASHIENIGAIIEANEIDIRSNIERVNLPKLHEILDTVRKEESSPKPINPLMTMIMDSDIIRKKLSQESVESDSGLEVTGSRDSMDLSARGSVSSTGDPMGSSSRTRSPRPVNPLMGDILSSSVLKKKLAGPDNS